MSLTYIDQTAPVFGVHLCRADTSQDHSPALQTCIHGPSKDWRCRTGRPRQTWLRTVEDDLCPLNFVLVTARRRALDRSTWRRQLMVVAKSTTDSRTQTQFYYKCM